MIRLAGWTEERRPSRSAGLGKNGYNSRPEDGGAEKVCQPTPRTPGFKFEGGGEKKRTGRSPSPRHTTT